MSTETGNNGTVEFVCVFTGDNGALKTFSVPVTGNDNQIVTLEALNEAIKSNLPDILDELTIHVRDELTVVQSDADVFSLVQKEMKEGVTQIYLDLNASMEWDLVETASQLTEASASPKADNNAEAQGPSDVAQEETVEEDKAPVSTERINDEDEPVVPVVDSAAEERERELMSREEQLSPRDVTSQGVEGADALKTNDGNDVEKLGVEDAEVAKDEATQTEVAEDDERASTKEMATQQNFNCSNSDASVPFSLLSDVHSTENTSQKLPCASDQDVAGPKEASGHDDKDSMDSVQAAVEEVINSQKGAARIESILTLLNSVVKEAVGEEIKLDQFENCVSSDVMALFKDLASKPEVVKEFQRVISSSEVRNFVVDLARNDVSNLKELKTIFLTHLGDILSVIGELFREAPQVLSALPVLLKSLLALLEPSSAEEDKPAKVVHNGVLCDGCDSVERKTQSMADGNVSGAYISGSRYKSAVRENFDLCASCEACGLFEEDYGPFLKITKPEKAPREILCILNPIYQPPTVQETAPEPPRAAPVRPPAPPAPQVAEIPKCGKGGHPLTEFTVPNRHFACDVCNGRPSRGEHMFGCRLCDWDMCITCANVKYPNMAANKPKSPSSGVKPRANFVADVNLPDGSVLQPCTSFTKIWRVHNTSATEAWPLGCKIVCVGGDLMGSPPQGFPVPPLPAQKVGDVCVRLAAPSLPGRYVSYWRLMTPDQKRFGQRFWLDVSVEDGAKVHVQQSVNVMDEAANNFAQELKKLQEMGFLDTEDNIKRLTAAFGNLDKVLSDLCGKK